VAANAADSGPKPCVWPRKSTTRRSAIRKAFPLSHRPLHPQRQDPANQTYLYIRRSSHAPPSIHYPPPTETILRAVSRMNPQLLATENERRRDHRALVRALHMARSASALGCWSYTVSYSRTGRRLGVRYPSRSAAAVAHSPPDSFPHRARECLGHGARALAESSCSGVETPAAARPSRGSQAVPSLQHPHDQDAEPYHLHRVKRDTYVEQHAMTLYRVAGRRAAAGC
jgi:hypothetical protein